MMAGWLACERGMILRTHSKLISRNRHVRYARNTCSGELAFFRSVEVVVVFLVR